MLKPTLHQQVKEGTRWVNSGGIHCGTALRCPLSGRVIMVFDSKTVSFALNFSAACLLCGFAGGDVRGDKSPGLAPCLGSKIRMRGSPRKSVRKLSPNRPASQLQPG